MAFGFEETSKFRNWVKGAFGLTLVKNGLQEFCYDIAKRQHEEILDNIKEKYVLTDVKCGKCRIETLRPDHVQNELKCCPLGQLNCNCQRPKGKSPCKNNVCGVIYDTIITNYASVPPTPNWTNSDASRWCSDPWEIAKCFINQNGYEETKTAQDTDCAALLSIMVNNRACRIHLKSADIFSKVRNETKKILHSSSLELDNSDINEYLDDMIVVLQNIIDLQAREESTRALENLKELRSGRYSVTTEKEIEVLQESCGSIRNELARTQNGVFQGLLTTADMLKAFKLKAMSRREIIQATEDHQRDRYQNTQLSTLLRLIQNKYDEVMEKCRTIDMDLKESTMQIAELCDFEIMLRTRTEIVHSLAQNKDIKVKAATQTILPSTSVPKFTTKKFLVGASCFPRYEYALQSLTDIRKRYKNVCGTSDNFDAVSIDICVFLCKENSEKSFPCHISDIVLQQGEPKKFAEGDISDFSDCFKANEKSHVSIFVGSSKVQEMLACKCSPSDFIFILPRSRRGKQPISKLKTYQSTENILIVGKETVGKKVEECLEKSIFDALRPVCEGLTENIENSRFKKRHTGENTFYPCMTFYEDIHQQVNNESNGIRMKQKDSKKRKTLCSEFETPANKTKVLKKDQIRHNRKHMSLKNGTEENDISQYLAENTAVEKLKQRATVTGSAVEKKPVPVKKALSKQNQGQKQLFNLLQISDEVLQTLSEQTSECLLEELIGVFNMSEVGLKEVQNIHHHRNEVDLDSLSKTLYSKFPTVRGVGFRIKTLQIDVEDIKDFDPPEKRAELRETLLQYNVHYYEIGAVSMKKYLTSGDEILVDQKRGSFGCFAKMKTKTKDTLCGLLSKHVATARSEIKAKEDGQFTSVGHILPDTVTEDGLDIAAAELSLPIARCDTRFKSSKGKPLEANRDKFTSAERLRGQKVHMWGAVSAPGNGIITIPDYRCKGMDYSLIQVEDIVDEEQKVEKRFAQPGDSGAVACADDPGQNHVHPISMNIGCMNFKEVNEDNENEVKEKRGKYLTLPLETGIQQLNKRTKRNFILY